MSDIILITLLIFFVVIPVIAALIAFVHAIVDSVTKRKFPNIVAILLLVIAVFFLVVWQYGDHLWRSTDGTIFLCFGGMVWVQLRVILQALAFVFAMVGLTVYIFLSFREDSVHYFRLKKKDKKTADGVQVISEKEPVTEEEIKESNRKTARLYRILTISVAVVLSGIVLLFLYLQWFVANTLMTHDLTEYTSPDGQYIIVVDNLRQGSTYGGDVYLRLNTFKVRRLAETEGRRKFMDVQYEDITWEDQGISIPYGNVKLFYYYEPVDQTD